jgi:PAS domain S-box-containing protein
LVETYITENYRDSVKQVLDNALKGKETANYEFPLFTKDGKRVMVLLNSSTRRNVEGEIVGVLGVGQDISEIDKLRTESESVAKELRQFIETANAPIFGIDSKGLVNEWNETAEKITGFKKEEVLGKDLVETYITEDYRDSVKQVLDNALKGKETANYEFPLFTKDDKRVMVLLNSSTRRNVEGEIVGVLGVGQDITIIDEYKENLEYKVKIRTQELAFQNDEKDKRAAELVIANKELAFQNDEKEKRSIELGIANKELGFQNNEKEKRALELVNAKEKAEESDRLKTAFLANMSHEIRTPMNGILGFSELLKTPNLSGEEQQDYIRIIEKSGHRMLNTINDIISISKIESGLMGLDIGESNINDQIEYIYTFFRPEVESKGLTFRKQNSLPFDKVVLKTDREKIFAILTNLVKNAIKFTETGSIDIGYTLKGEFLEFYVKDTGVGIDKEKQVAIFERFIQADNSDSRAYEGSGLGLSISKAFVEMLGGKLWVDSEKGKGSVFYFAIPYKLNEQEKNGIEIELPVESANVQRENLKILIVEDDETSDLLLSIRLKGISREILHAKNGVEAINICKKNNDIDLIMMDIKMPLMDGHEAARIIRTFNNDIIIIAQTAHAFEGDKEKAIASGCDECLSKPLVIKEVISLIQHYFH